MTNENPYQAPEATLDTQDSDNTPTQDSHLQGIGGWLILVAIGIVLSPFKLAFLVYSTYVGIFTNGSWEAITTVGNDAYDRFGRPSSLAKSALMSG